MVRVTEELALSPEHVTLYQTTDPLLGHLPVLVFHGSSTTANYTLNSSRVQVHIYSPAGFQCLPRITISPSSPFYSVVNYLPREFQGDELYRGLAFGLFKYLTELPDAVKAHLRTKFPARNRPRGVISELFGEQHAADLAQNMLKSDYTADAIRSLQAALQTQHISSVDIDFVLPPGSIVPLAPEQLDDVPDSEEDMMDPTLRQYTGYAPLVKLFGEPIFLPTSKLRRAPSRPTSLNRTKSFSRDQKQELRMKMAELVETEERYVAKLTELVRNIAEDFRQSAKKKPPSSLSPSEEELKRLFPKSADQILCVNSAFCHEMRKAMNESEREAAADADSGASTMCNSKLVNGRVRDPTGVLAIAKIFLEWFPKFTDCYQDYIRASQHFPQLLNNFLDQQSSFRQRVGQTGEQTMRSVLIEPVQRLPRYSLLIDQIVGCLPMTHPALQPMLRSRDIITNICSMDDPLPDKPHLAHRLRHMIEDWPSELEPKARLIMAVDFTELPPPFLPSEELDRAGVFLIFSDCVVVLNKLTPKFTGRELIREIDKPSPAGLLLSMTNAAGGPASYDLSFNGWHELADVRFTESMDGRYVWMTSVKEMRAGPNGSSKRPTSRFFCLQEQFLGKAAKFAEDIVKARVEARFAEPEREDPCWTLRSARMPDSNLGLYAAVFQDGADQLMEGRREPARIRIVIDHEKGTKGAPVGHYGVEIVVNVNTVGSRKVSMLTVGLNGKQFSDEIDVEDFLPTLSRRIIQLLSAQFNMSNHGLTQALVSYHTKVLKCLTFPTREQKARSFLGTSPVKLLSNLWNGTTDGGGKHSARTPVTSLFPPAPPIPRSNSQQSVISATGSQQGTGTRLIIEGETPENPLVRLEQTFTGYVAALQSRKGAIIGRMLLNRSMVDELVVNDLYNRLIEAPYDFDASADVSVEVIFAAFEKFLRIAWREQMGSVMTMQALNTLLERLNKRVPGDFADFVNYMFGDMAPQNRRAFTALIKLLTDLLDGCGNDGDRGALTVAFAELLVDDGTAQNYINLLDRLVEDCDRIFEEPHPLGALGVLGALGASVNGSIYESINSMTRASKSQTGSVTSNASSLRRKFGFDTLLRQNGRHDDRPSMWRTLSKHSRHPATGDASQSSSLSKASVSRSRSIDMGHPQPNRLRRPNSRDRPPVAGAFDDSYLRPTSSQRPLETIGEPDGEMVITQQRTKKKRRSSLSDLRTLLEAATLEGDTMMRHPNNSHESNIIVNGIRDRGLDSGGGGTSTARDDKESALMPLRINKQTSNKFNYSTPVTTPKTAPITSRIPVSPHVVRSPRQKENMAENLQVTPPNPGQMAMAPPRKSGHHKTMSLSNIPTLRHSRSAMPSPGSPERPLTARPFGMTTPNRPVGQQRLRLQSAQRLRERLQTERAALDEIDTSLQSELSRITEDMARLNSNAIVGGAPRSSTLDMRKLSASIRILEDTLQDMSERQQAVQRDVDTELRASDTKVRAIDQLYKEAAAENELLYEKFNAELAKVLKGVKGKTRDEREELMTKLVEQSEETAKLKKENARLKREMASLRAALRTGGESTPT